MKDFAWGKLPELSLPVPVARNTTQAQATNKVKHELQVEIRVHWLFIQSKLEAEWITTSGKSVCDVAST